MLIMCMSEVLMDEDLAPVSMPDELAADQEGCYLNFLEQLAGLPRPSDEGSWGRRSSLRRLARRLSEIFSGGLNEMEIDINF